MVAPPLPSEDATDEQITVFLRRSHQTVAQHLRAVAIVLPQGSLAAFDPQNQMLVIRTTNAMQERISALSETLRLRLPRYLTFSLQIIEAEATAVRAAVRDAGSKSDHRGILTGLEALVAKGQGQHLGTLRTETRIGQRVKLTRGAEYGYPGSMTLTEGGLVVGTQEKRTVGTVLEIDPVVGPDGVTMDVNLTFEHHLASPEERWATSGQSGGKRLEFPVPDFRVVKTLTAITLTNGTSKLLSVWKPEAAAEGKTEMLQAAFLSGQVVALLPAPDGRLESLLKTYGDKVEPMPAAAAQPPADLPEGMIQRRFRLPPDFLSASGGDGTPAAPADPFAPAPASNLPDDPRMTSRITALEVLHAQGIPFPPGSSANFNPATGELLVRNTPENMALIDAFIDELLIHSPMSVAITVQVVEADGATLRRIEAETAKTADHGAAWRALEEDAAQGKAKLLRTAWLETRSGHRATYGAMREHITVSGTVLNAAGGKKGGGDKTADGTPGNGTAATDQMTVSGVYELTPVGLRFEVDPVIGPDGETMDLNLGLVYDFAPPSSRASASLIDDKTFRMDSPGTAFHRADLTTTVTVTNGMHRLLGVWKPEGTPEFDKGDVLQAAFIKVDLLKTESPGRP